MRKKHPNKPKRQRKTKLKKTNIFTQDTQNVPKCMIFKRGVIGKTLRRLEYDLRYTMSPYTALKLKEKRTNTMRDFIRFSKQFDITHMIVQSQTVLNTHIRLCKTPEGPTIWLKINSYSTCSSIRKSQKVPYTITKSFYQNSPLVVLNNFTNKENHIQILATMLQNMFPTIDVTNIKIQQCKRVVLFNYNTDDNTIEFRHYAITTVPVDLTKNIRKVIKKILPKNLNKYQDINEWVENPNSISDSEADINEDSKFTSQDLSMSQKFAVKLKEVGPRMTLQLYKILNGVFDGKVLYHNYIQKTPEEQGVLHDSKCDMSKGQKVVDLPESDIE